MFQNIARTDEEYYELKHKIIYEINDENADSVFAEARASLLQQVARLDVNNITAVEDFYLIALKIVRSANFVLARERKTELGADDTINFLIKVFQKEPQQYHFLKIIQIEEQYRPGLQEWAQVHSYLFTVAKGLIEDEFCFNLCHTVVKTCSILKIKADELRKNKEWGAVEVVEQFIAKLEKETCTYLQDRNEINLQKTLEKEIIAVGPLLEKQDWWKEFIDQLINAIARIFQCKNSPHVNLSLFSNATKDQLQELDRAIKPRQ